jgi:sulfite reductase beta subunit-like hemoprotein
MQEAQREFKPISTSPAARLFDVEPVGWRTGIVMLGDLASAPTLVEILDTNWSTVLETVSAADYTLHPQIREAWEPIRRIEFNYGNGVTYLQRGFKVRVTGTWGFPTVPGNVRQAILDSVAWTMDRDVEHYRQDLGFSGATATPGAGGTVVMIGGGRTRLTTLPPTAQAVAWSYRDLLVG